MDKPDKEVHELLGHIEVERLVDFVARYAHGNESFKKDILGHFNPAEPQQSLSAYRELASACFDFEGPNRYGRGYDFYAAAYEAELALHSLLEKAKYFITQNNYAEAAAIAQSIIEAIPRHYETVDDSSGGLGGVFNDAVALLLVIVENERVGRELKTEIFHWTGSEVKQPLYDDYGFGEIHSLLMPCTQAVGLFNEALDIADERIQQASGNDYRLENAVKEKIRLLQQNNMDNEAALAINEFIELSGIRKMKVTILLEQGHYAEAILLIKEGINVAEKKEHPGTVNDWKDQLLHIYVVLDDRSHVLKYAEDLFYNGRDAMKYYHILKKETEPGNWAAYLDDLLAKHKNRSWPGYPDGLLASIYIEEGYWERLLRLVEKADIRGLETYEAYLKPHFPNELLQLFKQAITVYAERNMGRDHYQYVAGILKKMSSYPGGNQAADEMAAEFKIKYKARRAMMEELRGV